MSSQLYSVPEPTKQAIKKFRFASGRVKTPQAIMIKVTVSQEIVVQETEEYPISSIEELKEELPDNTPCFVLLSYPMTLSDGRLQVPLVLLYYRPPTASQTNRMTYAGAVELVRNESGVKKMVEIDEADDLDDIKDRLL